MLIKLLNCLLLTILIYSAADAQINPVYKKMIERGWIPFSEDDKTEMSHEQLDKEFLIIMGYNDSTVYNLKKAEIDFSLLHKQNGNSNVKLMTLFSDCIVIGKVERKEYPLHEDDFFHTIAYIKVEEFLKNDYELKDSLIRVGIMSGPTVSNLILEVDGEDTLKVGETVLLILSANAVINEAKINKRIRQYNRLINNPAIQFRTFLKFELKDEKAIRENNIIKTLASIRQDINSVLEVIK